MIRKIIAASSALIIFMSLCGCDEIFYKTPEFSVVKSEYANIIMPDLTGKTLEDANKDALEYKLNPIENYSTEFKKGLIFDQSVKAGDTVSPGAIIDVYVSKGTRYTEVPYVSDFTYQVAKTVLQSVGFEVKIVYEGKKGSCDDSVIAISHKEGTKAVYGSVITIKVNALEPTKIKTTTTKTLVRDGTRPAATKFTY